MKRFLLLLAVSAVAVITKAQNELMVDANAEVRTVNGLFNAIKVSGGIDLYLSQSTEEAVAVSASGASDINITVNKELSAHASGASDIYYKGGGLIKEFHQSGGSTIARKGI